MNKRFLHLAMATVITMFFTACEKDNQGSNPLIIEATGIDVGGADIATVKAVTHRLVSNYPTMHTVRHEIASAEFVNGGFKLILPATVPEKYLSIISENLSDGLVVSDARARVGGVSVIEAYDSFGGLVGFLTLESDEWFVAYLYADRNFIQRGIIDEINVEFDFSIRRGWNFTYHSNEKSTTRRPVNANFEWQLLTFGFGSGTIGLEEKLREFTLIGEFCYFAKLLNTAATARLNRVIIE